MSNNRFRTPHYIWS